MSVYSKRCVQCHGVTGDGNGEAAKYLNPRPRDYRRGAFKFKSTSYDARPRRQDLIRTVRQGIVGTSMPTFALLSERDVEAVVDYVLALTHRGELEVELSILAQDFVDVEGFNEAVTENDGELIATSIENVLLPWNDAADYVIRPLTLMPDFSEETVALGREAFLTKGCAKCHGPDGRGKTQDNVGTDLWGNFANAADLTSGMLHGGQRPIDIYRRVYAGIYGSPMPSFDTALADEPETLWHLSYFVLDTANRRRESLPRPPQPGEAASADKVVVEHDVSDQEADDVDDVDATNAETDDTEGPVEDAEASDADSEGADANVTNGADVSTEDKDSEVGDA
jgi:mono/diheme cytochrome c family protein